MSDELSKFKKVVLRLYKNKLFYYKNTLVGVAK